jgi:hypothetical protein
LLHLQRIKLRHGGVTVQTMSIEIEERRFDITRDGAPYPPILHVDDNFETAPQSRTGSGTRRVVRLMAVRGWQKRFEDPIEIFDREALVTLEDAAKYIQKLPKAEQQLEEWQAAAEALLLVVKYNGPTMMARIGVMRALNRHVVREFNPDRKDTHWGKRKLKRDQ